MQTRGQALPDTEPGALWLNVVSELGATLPFLLGTSGKIPPHSALQFPHLSKEAEITPTLGGWWDGGMS